MNCSHKIAAVLVIATLIFAFASVSSPALADTAVPAASESVNYPVILIHGLGEENGEEAFGNLKEHLESFYFDVEYMDFDSFSNHALAKDKDAGNLGTLAALLGAKINKVLKEYKTDKVNIVAHSYGGLIAHAYLLNFGADYDEKVGGFDNNVHRVLFIQVPFYGTAADEEHLLTLVSQTGYGVYLKQVEILRTLTPGSEWIYDLDAVMRSGSSYRFTVDAATFISKADEVVTGLDATLKSTLDPYQPYNRYRTFNNNAHSMNVISSLSKKDRPISYVDELTDDNCIAIISFLDGGNLWRKVGTTALDEEAMAMIKYEEQPGFKNIKQEDVTLTLKKKAKLEKSSAPRIKKGSSVTGALNDRSRVYTFANLTPGTYDVKIKAGSKTITEELEVAVRGQSNHVFIPKKKDLVPVGFDGIYYVQNYTYADYDAGPSSALTGLTTNSFEVVATVTGINVASLDKSPLFTIYDGNGNKTDSLYNNARLEVALRGQEAGSHKGKVMTAIQIDKNKNGTVDTGDEGEEYKSVQKFDWSKTHQVKLVITSTNNTCILKVWVDNILCVDRDYGAIYYNRNPMIILGCNSPNVNYKSPKGGTLTSLVVRNK